MGWKIEADEGRLHNVTEGSKMNDENRINKNKVKTNPRYKTK